jgi:hypothetical protein
MNMPTDEQLIALWEKGGFEAIEQDAKAAAKRDCDKVLESFWDIAPDEARQFQENDIYQQIEE